MCCFCFAAEEISRLRRQLEEMRKESAHYIELLKAHDINILEDPTIHWKGKKRSAKVAKVTPTHQLPKGIVLCSTGNVKGPADKQTSPGKQPSETIILQPPAEAGLRVNGALLQVKTPSSTPALLPAATPVPSTPGSRVIEQCVVETPAAAPALPPSVSYITLRIPAATTSLPQQAQPAAPVQTITIDATSSSQHPADSAASPVSTRLTFPQTSDVCSLVTQNTAVRTACYTAIPSNQPLLRAAGSTQTTWTTLQMAGNTVHPVCQSLPSPEVSNATQAVQQVTVCPAGSKTSVCPIHIQMQPHVPVQQTPITGHVQSHPLIKPPHLQPAMQNQAQPQPVLAPQPQCAVLPRSAIVPQPAVVAHPAVMSQSQPAVLHPASLVPHTPAALIPQPQPALVPQPQAAMLPLLQTMQVLQVNPAAAAASGATAPQNTNNPSLVILQQASACPAQPVAREEITTQTPCQHIVIIQAPSQAASAPPNPQVGMVPAASTQTHTTSSSVSAPPSQSVGGKQLVHILPRPVQPQVNHPRQVGQASTSSPVPTTPHTITVNGQVFALQPMKTSDKSSSPGGQSTLQLVQPTTSEEPTTNVALKSLGALSSLNQSISQGLPLSSQSSCQPFPTPLSAGQQQPPAPAPNSGATLVLPAQQLQVPCVNPVTSGQEVNSSKPSGKKLCTVLNTKRAAAKRTKPAKKKERCSAQAAAIPVKPAVAGESQTVKVTLSQVLQSSPAKVPNVLPICTATPTTAESGKDLGCVTSAQNTKQLIVCSSTSSTVFNPSQGSGSVSASQSESVSGQTAVGNITTAAAVKPSNSSALVTESKSASVSDNSSTVTKPSVLDVKLTTASTITNTTQSKLVVAAAVSKQSKPTAVATEARCTSAGDTTACLTQVCASSSTTTASLNQNTHAVSQCLSQESKIQDPPACSKSEFQPGTSSSVSTAVAQSSPAAARSVSHSSVAASATSSEFKKKTVAPRAPSQHTEVPVPQPSSCHPTEVKPPQAAKPDGDVQGERRHTSTEKESFVTVTSEAPSRKDFALPPPVYTNLDDQSLENPMASTSQTDSPTSAGNGNGRGFSVASMLPQGQSIGTSSGSFGTFTFTSEQAEMLALAMLEQDSPGRRSGGCSGENTSSAHANTAPWGSPKPPPVSINKDRSATGQQAKMTKPMDPGTVAHVEMSVRGQTGEGSVSRPNGSRHSQNVSYSQSQPLPQSQSSAQSGTAASLSVNNLVRPSSSHQPYPASPSLAAPQGSVSSPVGTTVHMSQASNKSLSPCSGAAHVIEYTTLKTSSVRTQPGNAVGERQVKIISKRQAQEEVMLNTGKRPKPCHPVGHMDVKAPEHSQMMAPLLPPTSSAVLTRISSESGGPLFSSNSFMSPAARPIEGHCPPQGPPEQNQSGLPVPQGHSQHIVSQPGQHLGGNLYMKQQQEQQRHNLYHLQHHLTQADPAQRHSLHQRALLQQQQEQQQHVQKKRGIVRGGQTGSPAGLQQKHHLEKSGLQQHSHQQQQQQPQHQQQHPHQQSQQHQQQTLHQPSHQQQHPQHQQPPPQAQQQQSAHSRHPQHLQQQIQQQHFRHQEKTCEAQSVGSRSHHSSHMAQQDHLKVGVVC